MSAHPASASRADFTQPIALMMDCHRRIERFLGVLRKVVERFDGGDLDREGRCALETSLNYLREAAPRHTEDEEHSLFPRMRRSEDPRVRQAMTALDGLEADHRRAEVVHRELDALGRRWLERGRLGRSDCRKVRALLSALSTAYAEHIRQEDERVFVLALEVLQAENLRDVGEEMRQRRIEDPGRPGSRCARRRAKLQEIGRCVSGGERGPGREQTAPLSSSDRLLPH